MLDIHIMHWLEMSVPIAASADSRVGIPPAGIWCAMGQGYCQAHQADRKIGTLLILGAEAGMNAGMGQRGIAYGNECLSVMLVSANHA